MSLSYEVVASFSIVSFCRSSQAVKRIKSASMRRCTLIALVVLSAALLSACGGGSQNSNAAKIKAAEGQGQTRSSIEQTLKDKLGKHFQVSGGECSVVTVVTGSSVSLYSEDEWTVTAPDGSAAVKVAPTEATPVSECMNAVISALAWE